jgi:hypothetical protein
MAEKKPPRPEPPEKERDPGQPDTPAGQHHADNRPLRGDERRDSKGDRERG